MYSALFMLSGTLYDLEHIHNQKLSYVSIYIIYVNTYTCQKLYPSIVFLTRCCVLIAWLNYKNIRNK